jgi:hypothetical protein|tara:strand:- start:229 stop:612 length:384 start_codon:yes stop_codon:yes gene_type:complete
MPLSESTWRKSGEIDEIGSNFPEFLQFFPDEGIALNITPTHKEKGHYLVWGGRYEEKGDGRVLTSLSGSSPWSEESYTFDGDCLVWTTANGKALRYVPASEDDIPPGALKYRDIRKREVSEASLPPE